jgi:hypothetical protein
VGQAATGHLDALEAGLERGEAGHLLAARGAFCLVQPERPDERDEPRFQIVNPRRGSAW